MSETHAHQSHEGNARRVQIALVLTACFMLVEVAGGIISGSLALLADAGHMLTDTMALALAAFAFKISARPANETMTFGYQRVQIVAAFVNGLTLIAIVIWIFIEAVSRFLDPPAVAANTMLLVASIGLVVNIIVFGILHSGDQENLNIRGAALHVLGDLLGSVAAIVAALIILRTGWMPIDPILSVLVAMLILNSAWKLVRRSSHILLEGAPEWLDVAKIRNRIAQSVPEVSAIKRVHVWGLTPQHPLLTMHVVLNEAGGDPAALVGRVKHILNEEFGIAHSTIEVEFDERADY